MVWYWWYQSIRTYHLYCVVSTIHLSGYILDILCNVCWPHRRNYSWILHIKSNLSYILWYCLLAKMPRILEILPRLRYKKAQYDVVTLREYLAFPGLLLHFRTKNRKSKGAIYDWWLWGKKTKVWMELQKSYSKFGIYSFFLFLLKKIQTKLV